MNIIIVGVGKVGKTLATNFINELHDVVAVDTDRSAIETLVNNYDVKGLVGSGIERDLLEDAGIAETDLFIACTSRDEMNVLACLLAKKLGAKCSVARVRDPELFGDMQSLKEDLGVDLFFNPDKTTAQEIVRTLKFPSAKNLDVFAGGKALLAEFEIEQGSPVIGKNLISVSKEYGNKVLFAVVIRKDKAHIPHGDFILQEGDYVSVVGAEKEVKGFYKKLKIFKPSAKSVILIGGGKLTYHVARELLKSGTGVKIIEKDRTVCERLADNLPDATIICGNGIDQSLLEEESISKTDAVVTLTESDESNVMISLYALQKKVNKVITKINRKSTIEMAGKIGLDTVVSPRNAIANQIIGFVRAHASEKSKGLNTFYKITDCVDAIEFTVDATFTKVGTQIKNLKTKAHTLIGGIVRNGEFILPSGETTIEVGDKVIVVTGIKQVTELTEIFR